MIAQVEKTRDLAGPAFSHVDFHMGHHRLPRLYGLFLEIAEKFGAGRIRTHVYQVGMESRFPRLRHLMHLIGKTQPAAEIRLELCIANESAAPSIGYARSARGDYSHGEPPRSH